jgi:hypothetical protein
MSSAIAAGQLFYAQLAVSDPQQKVNVQAIAVGTTESGTLAFVPVSLRALLSLTIVETKTAMRESMEVGQIEITTEQVVSIPTQEFLNACYTFESPWYLKYLPGWLRPPASSPSQAATQIPG